MLPNQYLDMSDTDFDIEENETSVTHKMHTRQLRINGKVDGLDAMEQIVYKILNTERYENPIYSWNYGIELADLYGEEVEWVCPELKRRIEEALTQDDRILSVSDFDFKIKHNTVHVTFTVQTVYGNIQSEKVVSY